MLDARALASYDSNVAAGDATVAALRRLKKEDNTYTLGTTATFQVPSSRLSFYAIGSADFERHQKNSNLDADNYIVTLGGTAQMGACNGTLVGDYSHRLALLADLTVPVARNIVDQESANVNVTCGRRSIFGSLGGGYTKLMNDARTTTFIDSSTRSVQGALGYQNKTLGSVALTGEYSEIHYEDDPLAPSPSDRVDQFSGGISYTRKIGNRLSGNAAVNYTRIEPNGGQDSSGAFGADVALTYRASPRLNLALDYTLANNASSAADAAYVRTGAFRVTGNYRLNTRISVNAAFSKGRSDYKGGQAIPGLQLRKSDDTTISGGAAMKIGRKISLTLDASHTDRKADLTQFNYRSDRVAIGITGSFF
ncbi:MAG: outer membrane beta-barrel protein [Phenylobacterium sp.]